jgi:hypothetical protein
MVQLEHAMVLRRQVHGFTKLTLSNKNDVSVERHTTFQQNLNFLALWS